MLTIDQESDNGDVQEIPRIIKYKLYLNRILSAWGDRMWQFAIGLFFIKLRPGSFTLASIHGIISSAVLLFVAPIIGRWIEKTSRLREVQVSLLLQNGFTILGAFCVIVYEIELFDSENANNMVSQIGLIIFAIVAQIWSVGYTTCLEKDWVICIANNKTQLTELNAILRRLDLICNILSPLVVGVIMTRSLLWSAVFLAAFNVFSAFCEYFLLHSIYKSVPNLRQQKKNIQSSIKIFDLNALILYFKTFFVPGLSFSLLYMTVLGFDSITIGYVTERGINETILSLVSVVGGAVGVIGTLFYPILVKRFGVKSSALIGFVSETVCLVLCLGDAISVWIPNQTTGIILLLAGITAARFGLWIADTAVNQLIQTTVSPPLISSVQTSVNISMELIKFVIVIFIPNVHQFYILIVISFCAVLFGTILFGLYTAKLFKSCESKFVSNEEQ